MLNENGSSEVGYKSILDRKVSSLYDVRAVQGSLLGLEIEAEMNAPVGVGVSDFLSEQGFRVKGDGSLRGYGVEFISRPGEWKNISSKWLESYKFITENKYIFLDTTRTGTHVHVNCTDLTLRQTFVFLTVSYLLENVLVRMSGPTRKGNLFCIPISHNAGVIADLSKAVSGYYCPNVNPSHKYAATNVASIPNLGTLEFRMQRGLSKPEEVLDWLLVIHNIKQFSSRFKTPQDVLDEYFRRPLEFIHEAIGKTDYISIKGFTKAELIEDTEENEVILSTFADASPDGFSGEKDWRLDKEVMEAVNKYGISGLSFLSDAQVKKTIEAHKNPKIRADSLYDLAMQPGWNPNIEVNQIIRDRVQRARVALQQVNNESDLSQGEYLNLGVVVRHETLVETL